MDEVDDDRDRGAAGGGLGGDSLDLGGVPVDQDDPFALADFRAVRRSARSVPAWTPGRVIRAGYRRSRRTVRGTTPGSEVLRDWLTARAAVSRVTAAGRVVPVVADHQLLNGGDLGGAERPSQHAPL
jgi:hypothetical protein